MRLSKVVRGLNRYDKDEVWGDFMGERNKKPKYSVLNNILFVIRSIQEYDKYLLGIIAVNAIFSALRQFVPVFIPKYIIDELTGTASVRRVIIIVLISGLVALITDGVGKTSMTSMTIRFIRIRLRLIARSGEKFMTMDFQNLEDPDVLDLAKRGDRACTNNQDGLEGVMHRLLSIFGRFIVLIGSSAIIATLHPGMIVAISILLILNFLVSSRARMLDKEINDDLAKVYRRLNYIKGLMSNFSYAKDIRLFGMKDFIVGKYSQEQEAQFAGSMQGIYSL